MKDKLIINKNTKFPCKINGKIHFIGLGGIGMSGLAKFLLELGYRVSGSDVKDGAEMFSIAALGGTVFIGHSEKNIGDASIIVASSAIKASNPEIAEAQRRNLPILHRSQLLEALMSGLGLEEDGKQISIGVSGTHGKTTTTGMISLIFEDAELNPSIVVGGQMPHLNTNSKFGKGGYFIAELDESDGTIELYAPDISVITNLELDHPDYYTGGFNQLLETFENYIYKLKKNSKIIINTDCKGNRELLARINHPEIITYSLDNNNAVYTVNEVSVKGLDTKANIYKNNNFIGEIKLCVPGRHNISNALAAVAAALECGIEFEKIADSLARFTGMKRRFQILGCVNSIQIINDYAHHPTELKTTLKAAKEIVESNQTGRVIAIFQPHRYSRLANFWDDFIQSFKDADIVYICDVYAAGEKPVENISAERLSREIIHDKVYYAQGPMERIPDIVCPELKPDDMVLTIGAGNITKLGYVLIEKLR
ncbi:MAG: UDP-N-acetylmuramate--L-alanine ligase [bacterium]